MAWLISLMKRWQVRWQRRYEPARHYMRGPGPASAKRARPAAERREPTQR